MATSKDYLGEHRIRFGALLAKQLLALRITQVQLADRLNEYHSVQLQYPEGLRKQHIYTWVAGRSYPPRSIDAALCEVLRLDPADLVMDI